MGVRLGYKRLLKLWDRYERPLSSISLAVGFAFDLFLAKRPDSVADNILLLSYLFIAASIIIILNLHINRRKEIEPRPAPLLLLLILQFCFGGLGSNLLVLYGHSGTFAASTLFFVVLVGMLVGNEFLRSRYAQLRFNIVVFYLLLFTYLIIAVPTFIFHSVGTLVFLASGAISLAFIALFLWFVYVLVFRGHERSAQIYEVSVLVALVFLFFNLLYFLQIIPPVPLSLKNIGIYHSLTRLPTSAGGEEGIYAGVYEAAPWFEFWRDTSATYTIDGSARKASCFSSVFAPAGLSTPVVHVWAHYDQPTDKWVESSRVSFAISGGRSGGYRGYTDATVTPGRWRCSVETQNGALIGRFTFSVVENGTSPALSTNTL